MKDILQGVKSLALMERSLDLRALKHLQIVSNIANASNPNYQPFEAVLDGALKDLGSDGSRVEMTVTNERHLTPGDQASLGIEYRPQVTHMEEEMARLTENNLKYDATVDLMNRKLRILKMAIVDRT